MGVQRRRGFRFVLSLAGVVAVLLVSSAASALAHIVYPGNAFEDIGYSDYRHDIVYASALKLIVADEGGAVYRPGEPLSRATLAHWAAVFHGLADADEPGQAQEIALEQGWVSTLEGTATYGDINTALFAGELKLSGDTSEQHEVTREQYAAFVIQHAPYRVNGKRLEERAGFTQGPAGSVEVKANESAQFGYELRIGGQAWELTAHPRILHAAGDPPSWDGRSLEASWMSRQDDGAMALHILHFREAPGAADEEMAPMKEEHHHAQYDRSGHGEETSNRTRFVTYVAALLIVVTGALAFISYSKSKKTA